MLNCFLSKGNTISHYHHQLSFPSQHILTNSFSYICVMYVRVHVCMHKRVQMHNCARDRYPLLGERQALKSLPGSCLVCG